MASVRVSQELLSIDREFISHTFRAFEAGLIGLISEVRRESPVFEGDLREGFQGVGPGFISREIQASLVNATPEAIFRIRGRGPGKFPLYGERSNLGRWARAKGIPAFVVARKIARFGTDRWINNENILGIDRTSLPGEEIIRRDSILLRTGDIIAESINEFRI